MSNSYKYALVLFMNTKLKVLSYVYDEALMECRV